MVPWLPNFLLTWLSIWGLLVIVVAFSTVIEVVFIYLQSPRRGRLRRKNPSSN